MMKQIKLVVYFLCCLVYTNGVYGQGFLSLKKRVKRMPRALERPMESKAMVSGGRTKQPWVVFSDRTGNYTTGTLKSITPLKELAWMEPLLVLKERSSFLKVAKYDPSLLRGRVINDSKKLVEYGWIPKSKLLLSQAAFTNASGFVEKAITLVNGKQPARDPLRYFDLDDSVYVFDSPAFTHRIGKVRLHELTYRYKLSADRKSVLIGNRHRLLPDSAKAIMNGWVSAQVLQEWGDRAYLTPGSDGNRKVMPSGPTSPMQEYADPMLKQRDIALQGFPIVAANEDSLTLKGAKDLFRKENNSLVAIDGSSLTYAKFLNMRERLPKMNVIWVLDAGSAMKKYFSGLTNIIQSLEKEFHPYVDKHVLNYGAVVYRDDQHCAFTGLSSMDSLTSDYRHLMRFLRNEAEKTASCTDGVKYVPLYDGVREALSLCRDRSDESNLIVVVGSVGDSIDHIRQLPAQIGANNARILTIQMHSDYNQWYNNFVLNAKKLVSESAVVLAERKKQYLIDGEGLNERQLYNTSQLDSISYYLDYPKNSLVQGGVVFPTKGEVMPRKQFTIALRRLLKETDEDINQQLRSLDSAFRLTGIMHENAKPGFFERFGGQEEPLVADGMPHNAFKFSEVFRVSAAVAADSARSLHYQLVLNQSEYDELLFTLQRLSGAGMEADDAARRSLYKTYRQVLLARQPTWKRSEVNALQLDAYFRHAIGFPLQENNWAHFRVKDIKNGMSIDELRNFRKYLSGIADGLESRGARYRVLVKNQPYYVIGEEILSGKFER